MPIVNHQFLQQDWFLPNWKCKTLILGSFNPACGEQTDYFYGRSRNLFWKAIALNINHYENLQLPENHFLGNPNEKFRVMKRFCFGCADVIRLLDVQPQYIGGICGNGYEDSKLFKANGIVRTYNFPNIMVRLKQNDIETVVIALGKTWKPKEFTNEIVDFSIGCMNYIQELRDEHISFSPRSGRNVAEVAEYLREVIDFENPCNQ